MPYTARQLIPESGISVPLNSSVAAPLVHNDHNIYAAGQMWEAHVCEERELCAARSVLLYMIKVDPKRW